MQHSGANVISVPVFTSGNTTTGSERSTVWAGIRQDSSTKIHWSGVLREKKLKSWGYRAEKREETNLWARGALNLPGHGKKWHTSERNTLSHKLADKAVSNGLFRLTITCNRQTLETSAPSFSGSEGQTQSDPVSSPLHSPLCSFFFLSLSLFCQHFSEDCYEVIYQGGNDCNKWKS